MIESPLGTLTISPAARDELGAVMEIYDDVAGWLTARGIGQWPYPQPRWIWENVERSIEAGEVFLCRTPDGQAVGTLRVQWSDPAVWPEAIGQAGYVHGLAVRRAFKGFEIGARMLEWAKDCARAKGKAYLRLDCNAENPTLRRYYEQLGLVSRGEIAQADYVAARYEIGL